MADNLFNAYNSLFLAKLFNNAETRRKREITMDDVREAITQVPGYYEDYRKNVEPLVRRRITLDDMVIAVCMDLEAHPVKVHENGSVEDLDGYDIQKTNNQLIMFT